MSELSPSADTADTITIEMENVTMALHPVDSGIVM